MPTREATSYTASTRTSDHTAFVAGDKVEYEGKLAKVIQFGFLELPTNPGQDAQFSDRLVAHLQLPAPAPGGKPERAFFVPQDKITSLKDNPKKQRALETEFNPFFGDPTPVAESENNNKPLMRGAKGTTKTSGEAARANRPPIDMVRATGADKLKKDATTGTVKTVDTSKAAAKPKAVAKAKSKAPKKAR